MCAYLQDLLFILLFSCAFGAAGVLGGLSVSEWDDNYVQNPAYGQYEHTLMAMKRYTVATTVSSLSNIALSMTLLCYCPIFVKN